MVAGGRTGGREDKGTASVFTVYDGAEASQMAPEASPQFTRPPPSQQWPDATKARPRPGHGAAQHPRPDTA